MGIPRLLPIDFSAAVEGLADVSQLIENGIWFCQGAQAAGDLKHPM